MSGLRVIGGIAKGRRLKTRKTISLRPATDFIKEAQTEGAPAKRGLNSFNDAWEVEKIHEALYTKALETLKAPKTETYDYWICPVCGYTAERVAPEKCPVCSTAGSRFERSI